VLHVDREKESGGIVRQYGEVTVNARPTIFKKMNHSTETRKAA
jgi:DEAD/DEAH box helicase domain-containing protein